MLTRKNYSHTLVSRTKYQEPEKPEELDPTSFPARGVVINKNTLEQFKKEDKRALIEAEGDKIREDIK